MQFTTLALCALSVVGAIAQNGTASASGSAAASSVAGSAASSTVSPSAASSTVSVPESSTAPAAETGSVAGAAAGMVKIHVVRVGGSNGSLTYTPNDIKVAVGEMVQFQFSPKNHSVVQSTFDSPCAPSGGIFSGFMPVQPDAINTPTYTIMINDTKPMWLYCSQGKHCQAGMVMVINVAATGNKTLAAYKALAQQVPASSSPSIVGGGSASNGTAGSGSRSGSGTDGSAPTGVAGGAPSSTGSGLPTITGNAAPIVQAGRTFAFGALVAAFFL